MNLSRVAMAGIRMRQSHIHRVFRSCSDTPSSISRQTASSQASASAAAGANGSNKHTCMIVAFKASPMFLEKDPYIIEKINVRSPVAVDTHVLVQQLQEAGSCFN